MKLIVGVVLLAAMATACAPRAASPSPAATSSAPTVAPATITGLVAYPAEGHPAMTICAFGATDRGVHYCVDVPQATTPPKSPYTISGLRPGTYHLFAYASGNDRAGGAYTEYVRCGLRATCSDHTLVDVVVRAGETVRDIELSDWYGPTDAFPPQPR